MRSILTISLLCLVIFSGCGRVVGPVTNSDLERAREAYRDSIKAVEDSSSKIDTNTKAAADSLALIAEKLDRVIENTSPRRMRAAGAAEESLAIGHSSFAPTEDATSEAKDQEPVTNDQSEAPIFEVSAPATVESPPPPAPALAPDSSTSEALDRLSERFEQLSQALAAPKSSPPSGNDITLPGGELVNAKEFIADHGTGRFLFEGDPAKRLAELGFDALELECLTAAQRGKVYDAWMSQSNPVTASAPQPARTAQQIQAVRYQQSQPVWQCNGRRCVRVR